MTAAPPYSESAIKDSFKQIKGNIKTKKWQTELREYCIWVLFDSMGGL